MCTLPVRCNFKVDFYLHTWVWYKDIQGFNISKSNWHTMCTQNLPAFVTVTWADENYKKKQLLGYHES